MNFNLTTITGLLILGLVAGILSSMVGIGGGILIVPVLVTVFALSQKVAQGTSLVMLLPPIGLLAVINYHKAGFVDYKAAAILIVAFVAGSFFGSKAAIKLDEAVLKKIFGVLLLVLSIKYLFFSK